MGLNSQFREIGGSRIFCRQGRRLGIVGGFADLMQFRGVSGASGSGFEEGDDDSEFGNGKCWFRGMMRGYPGRFGGSARGKRR